MRVALDTNVLIAAFATRGLCADLVRLVLAEHELVLVPRVRLELRRVLSEKLRLPGARIDQIEALLASTGERAPEISPRIAVRDPDDALVLAEAIACGADLLVTGDRDLLDAARRSPIPIVAPRAFWERVRSGE